MEQKQLMYTALYERLSHDDELQGESNSISNQKILLEEYARDHGMKPFRHFTDDGISGTRFDRPGFLQMMDEIKDGHVSTLIIKDMSRLGRDYIVVGQIQEMLRQKGVRLIAINDNHDSINGDDDFLPFRNIMNEWYAKDTSKKIKSVFQAKGRAGKHVASTPPYGYLKSQEDPNQWIVDEEAAAVIRRIFQLTLDGYGPYQICTILEKDRIPIPGYYLQQKGTGLQKGKTIKHPYHWASSTIVSILTRREYLGHTVNFKTKKHFKDSHSHYVDDDLWVVFENTQEPIIDQHTFDMVQELRMNVKRWPNGWGPKHPLAGKIFCYDCGGPLYLNRTNNHRPVQKFSCANYTKKKCKSGHRVDANDLMKLIGETLKRMQEYIELDRAEFVRTVRSAVEERQGQDIKAQKKRIAECETRQEELERLMCKIYEDNALGRLPGKMYETLTSQYEAEAAALEEEITKLTTAVGELASSEENASKFMKLISRYQNFDNLTNEMIMELIDKVVVHEREIKGSQSSPQKIDIYFNFIGNVIPAEPELTPEQAAAIAEEAAKKEKRRQAMHRNYINRKNKGKTRAYEEKYKPQRIARAAELEAQLVKGSMTKAEYMEMRKKSRTAKDIPEGSIGLYQ